MRSTRLETEQQRTRPLDRLLDDLGSEDTRVRLAAAKAISQLGGEVGPAIGALVEALNDRSILVRVGAAEALGQIGPAALSATPALVDALNDPYPSLRETAAEALGRIGPGAGSAVSSLCDRLRDPNHHVRSAAELALGGFGSVAVPCLLSTLANHDPRARSLAADALGRIGNEARPAVSELRGLLGDPDVGVRLSAAAGLWRITRDREFLSPLFAALEEPEAPGFARAALLVELLGPEAEEAMASARPTGSRSGNSSSTQSRSASETSSKEAPDLDRANPEPGDQKSWAYWDGSQDKDDDIDYDSPGTQVTPAFRPRPVNLIRIPSARAPEPVSRVAPRERPIALLVSALAFVVVVLLGVYWPFRSSERSRWGSVSTSKPGFEIENPEPISENELTPSMVEVEETKVPPQAAPVVKKPEFPADSVLDSVGIRLVPIRPGTFEMGLTESSDPNDSPAHPVEITRPFLLGAFEVTQKQWSEVVADHRNPSWFSSETGESTHKIAGLKDTSRHPVEQVNWFEAIAFCNLLSKREGLAPYYQVDGENVSIISRSGPGYRLPTEAEWEFACRAGTRTNWSFGDRTTDLEAHAWFTKNSREQTHPVGGKEPNGSLLHDMYGNVTEWCWDWDGPYSASSAVDPLGPGQGKYRILRGGAWDSYQQDVSSGRRSALHPSGRHKNTGFRVARNLPQPQPE